MAMLPISRRHTCTWNRKGEGDCVVYLEGEDEGDDAGSVKDTKLGGLN